MDSFVCLLPLIPIRKEPSHRSEQLSQLLFGETVRITGEDREWVKIRTDFDRYEGWMVRNTLTECQDEERTDILVLQDPLVMTRREGMAFYLPAGSEISRPDRSGDFSMEGHSFRIIDPLSHAKKVPWEYALDFLGAPYLWGGRTALGMDCSGLAQLAYKVNGIPMLRDACQQATMGTGIEFPDQALPDDLLFFHNEEGKVSHVGLYMGDGKIVHASGSVRVDTVDSTGIYRSEEKRYTHRLHSVKRLIT